MKAILLAGAAALGLGFGTAQAAALLFTSNLGPEVAGATGSGSAVLIFDADADQLVIRTAWRGLSGNTTVAHIHCCNAVPRTGTSGVAVTPPTLPGFPVGVRSGFYTTTIDLSVLTNYGSGFRGTVTDAEVLEARLLAGLRAGTAYLNIHSQAFPPGEIRGFFAVPVPMSVALLAPALLGLALVARRRGATQA